MPSNPALGSYLKRFREEAGETIEAVSDRFGGSLFDLMRLERSGALPVHANQLLVTRIAAAYGLTFADVESIWDPDRAARRESLEAKYAVFGAEIAARRRDLGLSQRDLGSGVGVSQVLISFLERGLRNPSPELAAAIQAYLGIVS